jgi:DNA invertase Pin-like site-specific DNA recombinase
MSKALNWADVLDRKLDYAVLRKENRLQVLVRPTQKQLRRRGKRSWTVAAALDAVDGNNGHAALPRGLQDAIMQTLREMARADQDEKTKDKKAKKKNKS